MINLNMTRVIPQFKYPRSRTYTNYFLLFAVITSAPERNVSIYRMAYVNLNKYILSLRESSRTKRPN